MDYEFRVIVEQVSVASQEVVKRETVKTYDIRRCIIRYEFRVFSYAMS